MTKSSLLLAPAVSEYSFYGEKSGNIFKISKNLFKFHSSPMNNMNLNKWVVSREIDFEGYKILSTDDEWQSSIQGRTYPLRDEFYFDSPEQAVEALINIVTEKITSCRKED
jgi:hypothetical protein